MSEYCVCCGEEIPEGRMVCPICEAEVFSKERPTDQSSEKVKAE